jgi:hypothetical protein
LPHVEQGSLELRLAGVDDGQLQQLHDHGDTVAPRPRAWVGLLN